MPLPGIKSIATSVWAAVNIGLVIVIGYQSDWGRHFRKVVPEPAVLAPEKVKAGLLNAYSLPPLNDAFTQTLARPLFVPTRRPAPPAAAGGKGAEKKTMKKGQFEFTGAMIMPSTSYAVLREISSGKTRIVQTGQTINGILVKSVTPDQATLTQYGDTEVLTMKVEPSPKGAGQPVKPAGAISRMLPTARRKLLEMREKEVHQRELARKPRLK